MARKQQPKLRGIFERPAGSDIWWICYLDNGKRHREKVGRRGDAIDLYRKRKSDIRAGIKLPPNLKSAGIKFKVLCDEILIFSQIHHRDPRNVESRVSRIREEFGERTAESIKPADIDSWISDNTSNPATANRYRATFSLIFREALRNGKVSSNPARLVRQRRENGGRLRYLLAEEEKQLRAVTPEQSRRDELTISLGTGMRLSEQYGLLWKQVDFKRKEIHLNITKNGFPRDIPMNADVQEAFRRLKDITGGKPAERVFVTTNPRSWFEEARTQAGLNDYVWHSNRHTFCSRLVMAGVSLKTVQVLAGHKTISMTARYSHLAPNTLHSAVELITSAQG